MIIIKRTIKHNSNQAIKVNCTNNGTSQVVQLIQNLPANEGDAKDDGSILGSGRSLEQKMAAQASILAWKIPWTEEPGVLPSTQALRRVGHDLAPEQQQQHTHTHTHTLTHTHTHTHITAAPSA